MKTYKSLLFILFLSIVGINALAETPQTVLSKYFDQAKKETPGFSSFSSERGKIFFNAQHTKTNGEKMSCTSCHGNDPKSIGHTRAHKEIKPIAWSANPERFTDWEKIEKWFRRNCNDVLERVCTSQEKGDFISYMMSIK